MWAWLDGKKTYIGGGLSILYGLSGMALTFLGIGGGLEYTTGLGFVSAGLVAVGLGGKLEKLKDVLALFHKK